MVGFWVERRRSWQNYKIRYTYGLLKGHSYEANNRDRYLVGRKFIENGREKEIKKSITVDISELNFFFDRKAINELFNKLYYFFIFIVYVQKQK